MNKFDLGVVNIYIDGAARGNPGPAGIGVFITNGSENSLKKINRYIGIATNNVAEYSALVCGLEGARSIGAEEIIINTDSELLVKQLAGEYKVKNSALRDLYNKAISLLDNFKGVRVKQIPRDQNKTADALANRAIEAKGKKVRTEKVFVLK